MEQEKQQAEQQELQKGRGVLGRRELLGLGLAATTGAFLGKSVLGEDAVAAVKESEEKTEEAKKKPTKEASKDEPLPKAFIDGKGAGWRELTKDDFVNVNCKPDTWAWKDGMIQCTGRPVGVMRTKKHFKNFELVCQWMHLRGSGNSGVFVWVTDESIDKLAKAGKPGLPKGIEVQVLDIEYGGKNPANWYTSHGDVFPVGVKMTPFPPVSPNGQRSFPSKNLVKGINNWNHYYIRAINGEIRLWVNGEEVSGGTGCKPSSGYLALESEGSPINFKNVRIRELP